MIHINQNMMILNELSIFSKNIKSLEDILFEHIFLIYITNYLEGLGYSKVKAKANTYFMVVPFIGKTWPNSLRGEYVSKAHGYSRGEGVTL